MSEGAKAQTTEERLRETVSKGTTASLARSFGGNPFYSHDVTPAEAFLCRELDEIRGQLARALGQLGMLGLPEPPKDGEHAHRKVFSGVVTGWERDWICAECLEEGSDSTYPKGPKYNDLVAKKRERDGG